MTNFVILSLVTLLSALVARADPKLALTVTGAEKVDGVEKFLVTATLTNNGNETLQLLNDPRSILSSQPTNSFNITSEDGSSPLFTGLRMKYVPRSVAWSGRNASFTLLFPGQSVDFQHDLSTAYNFTQTGEGSYTIVPNNLFIYLDPVANTTKRVHAEVKEYHSSLSGRLAIARKHSTRHWRTHLSKRALFHGCNDDQVVSIMEAADATKKLATESLEYLNKTNSSTERYKTWWGEYSEDRHSKLVEQYTKLANADFTQFNYDCSCNQTDVFAFVYPDEFGIVHLCGAFWRGPTTGSDSKAGTILHESTHFNAIASTEDHAYGQQQCKAIASSDPDTAIDNADSHEYFSENNPSLQ